MRKYPTFLWGLMLAFLSITYSNCLICDGEKADLITEVAISGVLTIPVGVAYDIPNVITNLPSPVTDC